MKRLSIILTVLLVVLICGVLSAQVTVRRAFEGEGIFHLKELQSFLTSRNDTLTVLEVLPTETRPEAYRDADIKENDQILMVNAKRVKTVADLEKLYADSKIEDAIKMGIRRNGQLMLLSFEKIDPEKLPKNQSVRIRVDDAGSPEGIPQGDAGARTVFIEGAEGLRPLFGTGLMLRSEDGKVTIGRILEGMTGALGDADVKEGDELLTINGQAFQGIDAFFAAYEKLETGSKVDIEYARADKKMRLAFEKPEARGRMIIRSN